MKLDTKFYEEKMKKTISSYSENLSTIRAGRANKICCGSSAAIDGK